MECPICHFHNRIGARFCQQCGQQLMATSAVATTAADGAPSPPPPAATAAAPAPAAEAAAPPTSPPAPALPPDDITPRAAETVVAVAAPEPVATTAPSNGPPEATSPGVPPHAAGASVALAPEPTGPATPAPTAEPSAFQVGATIAGRYLVLEVQAHDLQTQYVVRDRQLCHACQQPLANPDDPFCDNCGAALAEQKLLLDGSAVQGDQVVSELSPVSLPAPAAPVPRPLRLAVAARTHPGRVRELNEDSLSTLTLSLVFETQWQGCGGLYVVADGMGGHDGGEVASRLAVQAINAALVPTIPSLAAAAAPAEELAALLTRAVLAANQSILDAGQVRGSDMGSTVTLALVVGDTAHIANVGDSRTYHWSGNLLRRVTDDHSLVWSLVRAGQITEDEIYSHDMRNYIYRNLGAKPALDVDTFIQPLAPGDRLLLCSDGLWEMVRSEGIETVLNATPDPQAACDLLIEHANQAGGEDNITVIVVQANEAGRG